MIDNLALISIITPVYNAERYLSATLESCVKQSYKLIQIICIDDGSTDSSIDIVKEYQDKDARVILIEKKNGGVTSARLEGVKKAVGEFLFFLDADDTIPTDAINTLYQDYLATKADIIRGNFAKISGEGNLLYQNETLLKNNGKILSGDEFIAFCLRTFPSLCTALIKKSLFDRYDYVPLDVKVGEDLLTMFELSKRSKTVYLEGKVVYYYYDNSESVMNLVQNNINTEVASYNNYRLASLLYEKMKEYKEISFKSEIACKEYVIDKININIFNKNILIKYRKYIRQIYVECFLADAKMHLFFCKRMYKEYLLMLISSRLIWKK